MERRDSELPFPGGVQCKISKVVGILHYPKLQLFLADPLQYI